MQINVQYLYQYTKNFILNCINLKDEYILKEKLGILIYLQELNIRNSKIITIPNSLGNLINLPINLKKL